MAHLGIRARVERCSLELDVTELVGRDPAMLGCASLCPARCVTRPSPSELVKLWHH